MDDSPVGQELNALHPVREGNGRTQRAFVASSPPPATAPHRATLSGAEHDAVARAAPVRRPETAARDA